MELFDSITLRHLFDSAAVIVGAGSVVVELSEKIPFNPWSKVLGALGKVINKDMSDRLDFFKERQDKLMEKVNDLKTDMDERFKESAIDSDTKEAKRLRSRIIDFADSCRVHQKHTKTAFENISRDYDDYVRYCDTRGIPNHFIDAEYEFIQSVYKECQQENRFL